MRIIAQISDLHFGRHDERIVEGLLASLEEQQPDLIAVSGDFTQRARTAEFREAQAFLRSHSAPKLVVPGNHDVPLYNLLRRFGAPLGRYDRYIAPVGVPGALYRDEEIAVVGLNTARRLTSSGGRISSEHVDRIRQAFAGVPSRVFKTVVTHHPLGVPTGHASFKVARQAPSALGALAELDVHLLLSGHRHRALSGHIDIEIRGQGSILVVHAGTAVSTRTRDGEANSYNLIGIDGPRVMIDIMQWSPDRGFHNASTACYRFADGVWRTDFMATVRRH